MYLTAGLSQLKNTLENKTKENISRQFGIDLYTLLYLKFSSDLLYSTENAVQYSIKPK